MVSCLVYPRLLDRNDTFQIASLFRYDLIRWYSPVYHTNVILEQYNEIVISPTVTELISHEIYSPNILKSAGNDIFKYLPSILELLLKLLYYVYEGRNAIYRRRSFTHYAVHAIKGYSVLNCTSKNSGIILSNFKIDHSLQQFPPIDDTLIHSLACPIDSTALTDRRPEDLY